MIFATVILTSQEWIRLKTAAKQQFPNERLAQSEILRRFSLSGIAALKAASDEEKRRAQWKHQSTTAIPGPEGEKPRGD